MPRRTSGYRARFPAVRTARSAASRARYSAEQHSNLVSLDASPPVQTRGNDLCVAIDVVPETTTQGMRKAKNFTCIVNIASAVPTAEVPSLPYVWALVYVPAGTTASYPSVDQSSLYEPNQFVIACGSGDLSSQALRVFSPLARNLNSGDKIQLVIRLPFAAAINNKGNVALQTLCRYAITLQ